MVVYMTVNKDNLQLPTGVYNNVPELIRAQRISDDNVYKQLRGEAKLTWIFKIEIEEE